MVLFLKKTKKWILPKYDDSNVQRISQKFGVSALVAKILCARGIENDNDIDLFINKDKGEFYNPMLLNDMAAAVEAITAAINDNKKIAVYGDYDVDGITSVYLVYDYLLSKGADVIYYIPDRISEGYGINKTAIDTLKNSGVSLIITVDVGITAISETEYARENGIDMIITDHHSLKDEIPNALAVINPKIPNTKYPFDALAGVGVAFKLVYALSGCDKNVFNKYCSIAAVGTIADMVPLQDENRYIAYVGIEMLKSTDNLGLRALADAAGCDICNVSASDIGFSIAPRLNAAGRIEKANISVELLLEKDESRAAEIAAHLNECNRTRQDEEQKILKEALEIIHENSYENDNYILVAKENWLHGVIGIVSSKLTEMFYKPSSVISIDSDGTGKASGRSIAGINLFDALCACSGDLIKFGGHELAAGFSISKDKVEEFRNNMNEYMQPLMTDDVCEPTLSIDTVIKLSDINLSTVESLNILEPCGICNKTPTLCISDITVDSVRYTQNGKHAFVNVSQNGVRRELPAFGLADEISVFSVGDRISVAGFLSVNSFRGNKEAQFIIRDIHESDVYRYIDRSELARIFSVIRSELCGGELMLNRFSLLPAESSTALSRFKKLKRDTALKVFRELDILNLKAGGDIVCITEGRNFHTKTSLEDSPTYMTYKRC